MNVIGDICFPTGKYIDKKTNEEKTTWTKCGALMQSDRGYRIKLDVIPLAPAENSGWFMVFEKKDEQPKQQNASKSNNNIPF